MLGPEKLRSNPRDVEENMLRDKSSRACPQAMILADLTSSILQTIVSALPMLGWPKTDFLLKRCQSNQLSILDMPGAVKPFCARTPTLIGVTCFVLLPLCLAEDFSSFGFQGLHRNETAHRGHSQSQPLISGAIYAHLRSLSFTSTLGLAACQILILPCDNVTCTEFFPKKKHLNHLLQVYTWHFSHYGGPWRLSLHNLELVH